MRISELSRVTGVPVATIKFYLRDGLLPEGVRTSPNQAQYGDRHVERLRLVRALVGVGGLSLAAAKDVLAQVDGPPDITLDLLGRAHRAVTPQAPDDVDVAPAVALLRHWGWTACADAAESGEATGTSGEQVDDLVAALAGALTALDDAGFTIEPATFDQYAVSMMDLARAEIAGVPTASAEAAVRYVVLGTVLVEPVLLALRRLAQREASAARFPART